MSLDFDEVKKLMEQGFKDWEEDNRENLQQLPAEAIKAIADLAVIAAIPKENLTPKLAILKMQKAASLLESAAAYKDIVQELQESAKEKAQGILKQVVGIVVGALLA